MEIQLQEENESKGANGPNGRPIFPWKTHCVFDVQILSENGAHEAVLDYWDQFSITSHGDDIQNFDNCWDQVFLSTSEVPTDSILESLYKRRTRVSSTRAGALSCLVTRPRPLTTRMSPEVQGHRPARPHEIFTPETNELKQEYWSRLGKEGMSELKGNKEIANSGKQTDSVQRKCLQIPPRSQHMWTTSTIVFSCSKTDGALSSEAMCVLALRRWAHSWNARRDQQDRCSPRRWRSPKHRARHSCTQCCDTRSERWSTGGPGGMDILGPASRLRPHWRAVRACCKSSCTSASRARRRLEWNSLATTSTATGEPFPETSVSALLFACCQTDRWNNTLSSTVLGWSRGWFWKPRSTMSDTHKLCRHHTYLYARRRTFLSRTSQCTTHSTLPMWAHRIGSR